MIQILETVSPSPNHTMCRRQPETPCGKRILKARLDSARRLAAGDACVASFSLLCSYAAVPTPPACSVGFAAQHDVICEFLAESVLDTLEPKIADFMLATSITEKVCGGLASALSEQPRGLAMLEEVARRGLFLHRVDDDPGWIRYHQLFAEFLRRRLARDDPERSQLLHRTAAAWFAEHGYLNEAVNHALAAGDPTLAVDLVEQDETRLLEQSK